MSRGHRSPLDGGFDTVSDNQRATRDQLNMTSIDGQDLAERMFPPAPTMTRVFGE